MGLFDDDDWGRPVEGTGEYARVDSLANHLLIIFPLGYIDHSPTKFTVPGKKSDVIVCDVIDLDDVDETGNPGKVYRTAWWRGGRLIGTLRPFIGKRVLGRIGKGISTNGMNPPWAITDSTQEPGAVERALAWGQTHTDFTLSQFQAPPPVPVAAAPTGYGAPAGPQQPVPGGGFQQYPQTGYQQPQPGGYSQQPYQQQPAPPAPPQQQWGAGPVAPQQYPSPPQQQYPQQPPAQQYPQQPPPQLPPPQQYPQQYPQQGPPQQYQQPPAQQFQPPQQQGYQGQPPVPAYPVAGAPPQDQNMLATMRAERARREAEQAAAQWPVEEPPF